jgi:hypothetical protein
MLHGIFCCENLFLRKVLLEFLQELLKVVIGHDEAEKIGLNSI